MPAPTLGTRGWQLELITLREGWDGDGGKPITEKALLAVDSMSVVPCSSGGLQLEFHQDGFDIEIEIGPDGRIVAALVAHDRQS